MFNALGKKKKISSAVFEKLMKSKEETAHLTIRNIYCPFCGYLVEKVFSDVAGHKQYIL